MGRYRRSRAWPYALVVPVLWLFPLFACGSTTTDSPEPELPPSAASSSAPPGDASASDAPAPPSDAGLDASDASSAPKLVSVGHDREIRGVWVASVFNLDWPSRAGLPMADAKRELSALLDTFVAIGANVVNLQVRPESDAFYLSTLEPFSRFLTGTQGNDPGWDPLRYALDEAHARGLELHAWLNPFRAATSRTAVLAPTHIASRHPELAHPYGSSVTMDPGSPIVRDHLIAVVRDLLTRYDVDGVIFDDYFYPYPIAGTPFPDDDTYADYLDGGGTLSKSDFRRANVNDVVHAVNTVITSVRPSVRFGVSPFGIYRPGMPPGVVGLDAYEALAADALAWLRRGDVDYLGPQLYWTTTSSGQPFGPLLDWWAGQTTTAERWLVPSIDITKIGTPGWDQAEMRAQFAALRAGRARGVRGTDLYAARTLRNDTGGIATLIRTEVWPTPALPPPLATARTAVFAPPTVRVDPGAVQLSHTQPSGLGFAVYGAPGRLVRWVRARAASIVLDRGTWAISSIDERGVESLGVEVQIP